MTIDPLLRKTYHASDYNCAHFVCEAWAHITGKKLDDTMKGFLLPSKKRFLPKSLRSKFQKLSKPQSPCIIYGKNGYQVHVGVFYNNKILHITPEGVKLEKLWTFSLRFKKLKFYKCEIL